MRTKNLFAILFALAFAMGTIACDEESGDSSTKSAKESGNANKSVASTDDPDDDDDDSLGDTKPAPAPKVKCPAGCVPKGVTCPAGCVKGKAKSRRRTRRTRRTYRPKTRRRATVASVTDPTMHDRVQDKRMDAIEQKDRDQDTSIAANTDDIAAIKAARAKEDTWRKGVDAHLEAGNK